MDRFLHEVLDFPEGWALGEPTTGQRPPSTPTTSPARDASGRFTHESVAAFRGACTDPDVTKWGEGGIRFFFAEVGGIVFEVMRVEDSA